ncbi:hypothetical protein EGR_10033 [Echinococcus granulosus]|uniref:Uncharacterized protein n=1 Tax=Echinococcus granulosus TaxID=6210 RepID=W6U3G0_ECHGR|nr:hypothetical protein EGR_10033 [Echinococcus granulosus]EUB55096.1 hypothetical protein EGR_10033 [Echinococcus granulosus]
MIFEKKVGLNEYADGMDHVEWNPEITVVFGWHTNFIEPISNLKAIPDYHSKAKNWKQNKGVAFKINTKPFNVLDLMQLQMHS